MDWETTPWNVPFDESSAMKNTCKPAKRKGLYFWWVIHSVCFCPSGKGSFHHHVAPVDGEAWTGRKALWKHGCLGHRNLVSKAWFTVSREKGKRNLCYFPPAVLHLCFTAPYIEGILKTLIQRWYIQVVHSQTSNARKSYKFHPQKFWIFQHCAYSCTAPQSREHCTQLCPTRADLRIVQNFKKDMSWDISFLDQLVIHRSN